MSESGTYDTLDVTDATPVIADPCRECGGELIRIADSEEPPMTAAQAWKRSLVCISSRNGRWSWCPRTGWLKVQLDRRATPRLP